MNEYCECWKKYAVFAGRARRREYWLFILVNFLVSSAIGVVGNLLGLGEAAASISGLYSLAALLPGLAVSVRRLHDTDRSGWWLLLGLVPVIGTLVLFVFMCLDSQPGANRFGPNPKA